MTRETLDKLRSMGMNLGSQYDVLADALTKSRKNDADNAQILNIQVKPDPQNKQDNNQYFIVRVELSSSFYTNLVVLEIDGKTFQAYKKGTISEQFAFYAQVFVDFSIPRIEETFILTATLKNIVTGQVTNTKSVNVKVNKDGNVGVTDEKTESIIKNTNCFCDRDFELNEFEKIIYDLRKSETKGNNQVDVKLFQKNNCKLKEEDKTTEIVLYQLNSTFSKYGITKCIHKIHFLAQIYHETDRLKTTLEYATDKDYKPYFGRGAMQLTHKSNYKIYTAFYNKDAGTEDDFVIDYSKIAENLYHVFNSAGWYWKQGKALSKGKTWKPSSDSPKWLKKDNPSFPKTEIKYRYKQERENT
jgi:hypothetical protein